MDTESTIFIKTFRETLKGSDIPGRNPRPVGMLQNEWSLKSQGSIKRLK
jgi:hypothetical protein